MKLSFNFIFAFAIFNMAHAEPFKIGVSPALSSAGIYLAQAAGYFKESGLDIELITVDNSGASMTLLLAKGDLDVGAGNLTSGLFNAILDGQKIKIVADKGHVEKDREYIGLVVREDHFKTKRFGSIKDLKGFKIGLTALNGVSQQIVMERILKQAGLGESDIQYVKMSYPEMNTALKTKNLDAAIQLEPYISKGIIDKSFRLVDSSQKFLPDQQSAAVLFSPKVISTKREQGILFMKAYLKGVRLYNAGLKDKKVWNQVVQHLQPFIKLDDERIWQEMRPVGLADDGEINVKSLMQDLEWYKNKGYIKRVPTTEELFDFSFIKEAVTSLGKKS